MIFHFCLQFFSVVGGEVSQQQAWTPSEIPKTAKEMANFKNKIPFDEDMYVVLKTTIELMTSRIKNHEPLKVTETAWLSDAVEIIIQDARTFGPPPKPVKAD